MNHFDYGTHRWQIVYGCYAGVEKTAVDRLYGLIQGFVPYILTAFPASDADTTGTIHQVILGTIDSNPLLCQLADFWVLPAPGKGRGLLHPNRPPSRLPGPADHRPAGC